MTRPLIFLGSNTSLDLYIEVCIRREIPIAGIIDSDYYGNTESFEGIPIIGSNDTADWALLKKDFDFFIATNGIPGIPRGEQRRNMFLQLVKDHSLPCANLIDPESRVGRHAQLGQGIFVGFSAVVNSHVKVGNHCQIHALAGVAHHTTLGENVCVQRMALVTGNCTVGDNAYIGLGARMVKPNGMYIGKDSLTHPGVVVMRDVEDEEVISLTGRNTRRVYQNVVVD